MTRIGVQMQGMAELVAQLKALGADADEVLDQVKFDLAFDTQALAIHGIQHSGGGGRTYEKYNPRRSHTASAPGKYPSTDTGRLANSIGVASDMADRGKSITVGTAVNYGPWLEFGTSRMAARPWLLPSFNVAKIGVEKELKLRIEALAKGL
jgi:hypothetical protein